MAREQVEYVISLKDLFSKQIETAIKKSQELDKAAKQNQITFSGIANVVGGLAAGFGVASFAQSVFQTGQQFEKFEVGLRTFTGSAEIAKQVFNDIKRDAANTPFEVEPLFKGVTALVSTGLSAKEARRDVLALGNAIVATGGGNDELQRMVSNLQQIKNVGKATAADLRQFGYAGINVYKLLEKSTGIASDKLAGMDISYQMLTEALRQSAEKGGIFFGAMDNAMGTTAGQLSNLSDSFKFFANDIFEALKPAIDSVISGLASTIDFLKDGVKWMKENRDVVGAVAVAFITAGSAILLYNTYIKIAAWYTGLSTAAIIINTLVTEGLSAAWAALNIVMTANPIGVIVVGLGVLAGAVYWVTQNWNEFKSAVISVWDWINKLSILFPPLWLALRTLSMLVDITTQAFSALGNVFGTIKESFYGVVNVFRAIGHAIASVSDAFEKLANKDFKGAKASMQEALSLDIGKAYDEGKQKYITDRVGAVKAALNLSEARSNADKVLGGIGASTVSGGVKSLIGGQSLSAGKSQSVQPKNTYININSLINTLNLTASNLKESTGKIKEEVEKVLLSAVNDANLIADR